MGMLQMIAFRQASHQCPSFSLDGLATPTHASEAPVLCPAVQFAFTAELLTQVLMELDASLVHC